MHGKTWYNDVRKRKTNKIHVRKLSTLETDLLKQLLVPGSNVPVYNTVYFSLPNQFKNDYSLKWDEEKIIQFYFFFKYAYRHILVNYFFVGSCKLQATSMLQVSKSVYAITATSSHILLGSWSHKSEFVKSVKKPCNHFSTLLRSMKVFFRLQLERYQWG